MGRRVLGFLLRVEEDTMGAVFLSLALMTFLQVVLRYVLGTAISWLEEVTRFTMIMVTFFGAALGVERGGHFGVEILTNFLPSRQVHLLRGMTSLVSAAFILVITYYGIIFTANVRKFGQTSPALQLPMFIPYAIIPTSGLIMAVRFCLKAKEGFSSFIRSRA
jgi:C4-dicarboxylate transporter DctQ subunit